MAAQQLGKPSALRLTLQKDVFTAPEERLLGVAVVTKPGKKIKKTSYLCVTVNLESKPACVYISRVKKDEKKERSEKSSGLRRVRKWKLSELRLVDGKSADSEVSEFDLHFDKGTFKWVAGNVMEKKAFVVCLYKLVHKYLDRKKPEFVNVDEERLQELTQIAESAKGRNGQREEEEEEVLQQEEYQELTDKEQEDLEKLLKEEERRSGGESAGVQDIAVFTENLSQQLGQLDDANIHMLMGSEEQIQRLMGQLDASLTEIQQMETKLFIYDELLTAVRGSMSSVQKDYSRISVWDKNLNTLLSYVEDIVNKLYLDPRVESVLRTSSLSDETSIRDCTNAVRDLHKVMNRQLSQGVQIMQAVSEQRASFATLSFEFGKKLHDHLIAKFNQLAARRLEAITSRGNQGDLPRLPAHTNEHNDLMQYCELTKWMKDCQSTRFDEVCKAYSTTFKRVYQEEIKAFMADVKALLSRGMEPKRGLLAKVGSELLTSSHRVGGSTTNVANPRQNMRTTSLTTSLMDFSSSPLHTAGGVTETIEKPRMDQVFLLIMEQMHPVCVSEQRFCTSFFHFPKTDDDDLQDESMSSIRSEGVESVDGITDMLGLTKKPQHTAVIDVGSVTRAGVMGMLKELFACLLTEIQGFVQFGEKLDSYNGLYLLMAVKHRLMFAREGGKQLSYLEHCLEQAMLFIIRLFEKLITSKNKSIEECKVPRKGKWGILHCVTEFSQFAKQAEGIVMGADQREEINAAYQKLIQSVFVTIERVANEHPKTPDVVKFENYHWLYDVLSQLRITCLDSHREEAKQRFRAHQQDYVTACLGKPLKNLSIFFEGVEGLLASGMKPEQVGFWRDYSKTELQKCISAYPGKEVKKGLEKLYRRIDGDLTEEVALLRVTWGAMQNAFMQQYKHFEKLIAQCYPGANIKLEFDLTNLMTYFNEISESK